LRLLHTADWHVGRTIRGRARADEHRAALDEIARIARERDIDAAIVAGDLFDTAAPSPESERIVYHALLALAESAQHVVVIAGNHDHPQRLSAVRPLLELGRVHVATQVERPHEGGVLTLDCGKERVRLALVPFLSQRTIITADLLMEETADKHVQEYADRYRRIMEALTAGFAADAVNVIVAHATVVGARLGGGERDAHTIDDYHVATAVFPASAHYVALGHVHRAQQLAGPCPIRYCGSPLQLDFGETGNEPRVLIVEAEPGRPARVEEVPITAGRRLRTVRGTMDALALRAAKQDDDAYLRVIVDEPSRSGLADEVRALFPNAVDVIVARPDDEEHAHSPGLETVRRSPRELFDEFLKEKRVRAPTVSALFAELIEAAHEEAR
jgi:exonuclease SbcD